MRRIRLRTGPAALFGAIFVVALILFLPMRLALGWMGLGGLGIAARQVHGSVWFGELIEVHAGGVDLGDVAAGVTPVPLVLGRAHVAVKGEDDAPLQGTLSLSRHSFGVVDLTAGMTGGAAFAPLPVTDLDLDDVTARFKDGACNHAEGRVRITLAGAIGGVALPQVMAGTARCDGTSLLLPLASTAGTESLDLRLNANDSYRADLAMRTGDPQLAAKLQVAGFRPSANGYLLSLQGRY